MHEDFDDELLQNLKDKGFNLFLRTPTYDFSNGITSSIMFEDGNLIGVSDYRSEDYLAIGLREKNE